MQFLESINNGTYNDEGKLGAWFSVITKTKAIAYIRKEPKHKVMSIARDDEDAKDILSRIPDTSLNPEELLIQEQQSKGEIDLGEADKILSPIEIKYFRLQSQGKSYQAIADQFKTTKKKVAQQFFRSREKVRKFISGDLKIYPSQKKVLAEQHREKILEDIQNGKIKEAVEGLKLLSKKSLKNILKKIPAESKAKIIDEWKDGYDILSLNQESQQP